MILQEIQASTGDPATNRSFNVIQRDDSGYIYCSGYADTTWIYGPDLAYITEDPYIGMDFQLWRATGYYVQTLQFPTKSYFLSRFDGSSVIHIFNSTTTFDLARGCAVNGSYAYFWNTGNFHIVDYNGDVVDYVASSLKPRIMYCFDGGNKLLALSDISGVGAYLCIYSLSGTSMTLITSYTLDSSTSNYVNNNCGYPSIDYRGDGSKIIIAHGTSNPIKELYFDGSTITQVAEYPYPSTGVMLSIKAYVGDTIFTDRAVDYTGSSPYGLVQIDNQTYQLQSSENLITDPGIWTYGDDLCLVSKWYTGSRVKLYKALPAPNHEHFQAIWR